MAAWGHEFYILVLKVSHIKFVSPRGYVIPSISLAFTFSNFLNIT